jgi:hypothetical protein
VKKKQKPADENGNSSNDDDLPLTRKEVEAVLSETVNIATSTVLPDLRAPIPPQDPPKKINFCQTPAMTVRMKQHVNTTPGPDAIDLKDLVVEAPMQSAKPGEPIPKLRGRRALHPPPSKSLLSLML